MSSTAVFRAEEIGAACRDKRAYPLRIDTSIGTVELGIHDDIASLKPFWEALQAIAPCGAAQTYDWARAWATNVLAPAGRTPVIVTGRLADGVPLFLWAFEIQHVAGQRVLRWLGHAHANYNMGLFTPAAGELGAADLSQLLHAAGRAIGAAAAVLTSQPFAWDDAANPFALLRHRKAPNSGYALALGEFKPLYHARFSKRSRHTLERKQRKLTEAGALRYGWAETAEARETLLDIVFSQKAEQLAAMGVGEVFDAPVRAFFRELALLDDANPSRLRIGYLMIDDQVLATFSGTLCHGRLSVCLSSLAEGDLQRQSPGALLLRHQIAEASADGIAIYDLGVGAARHKDEWCDIEQKLFDSFIAFTPRGLLVTLPFAAAARAKRLVKGNKALWHAAQALRRMLFARKGVQQQTS